MACNISLYVYRRTVLTVAKLSLFSRRLAESKKGKFWRCVIASTKKLLIGLEVIMKGSYLKQTVCVRYKRTELTQNRGQIWTQHVWKPQDKDFVPPYRWI